MKKQIQDKIRYYETQQNKFLEKYLESNLRRDRDTLMRVRTKVQVYKEVLTLIQE